MQWKQWSIKNYAFASKRNYIAFMEDILKIMKVLHCAIMSLLEKTVKRFGWKIGISYWNIEKYVQLCDFFFKLTLLLVLLQNFTHYQTFFTIVKTAATTNKIWPNGEKTMYNKFFKNVSFGRSMERNFPEFVLFYQMMVYFGIA